MAKLASEASWQVKALVEATPISGPAMVGSTMSESRAMEDSSTLTTAMMVWSLALASRNAASVSAVSPDWEMNSAAPPFG